MPSSPSLEDFGKFVCFGRGVRRIFLARKEVIFWRAEVILAKKEVFLLGWGWGYVGVRGRGGGDNLFIGQNIFSGRSLKQQEKVSSVGTFISSFHSSCHPSSTSTSKQLNWYVVKPADGFDGLCQLKTAHTASFTGIKFTKQELGS